MSREDRMREYEAAFERIVPIDEAHRTRLEKMRVRFREIGEESAREITKAKAEMAAMNPPEDRETRREEFAERIRAEKEAQVALRKAFEEHAALIDRITSVTQRR